MSASSSQWSRACRSEPQMPQRSTFSTSWPRSGLGSGRSTTANSPLVHVTAFMGVLPENANGPSAEGPFACEWLLLLGARVAALEDLVAEPDQRVVLAVDHALLHGDQRVVGDLDVLG